MRAADIMSSPVITAGPDASVIDAVRLMLRSHVSGLPVVAADGTLAGIVTEGDLLRRVETDTERHHSRWAELFRTGKMAEEYTRSHGRKVSEVMTTRVATVEADTPLATVVDLMETKHVKRLPVLRGGKLAGIVSRSDLLRALVAAAAAESTGTTDDNAIRERLAAELGRQRWTPRSIRFSVKNGVVALEGVIFDDRDRAALCVAAENVPGVKSVKDKLVWIEPMSGMPILEPEDRAAV